MATTIHNKNSSRFGKWLSVYFDERGRVAACNVRHFLLEQSRVVGPPEGERSSAKGKGDTWAVTYTGQLKYEAR